MNRKIILKKKEDVNMPDELLEDVQKRFINNLDTEFHEELTSDENGLMYGSVRRAFTFSESPEGYDYWDAMSKLFYYEVSATLPKEHSVYGSKVVFEEGGTVRINGSRLLFHEVEELYNLSKETRNANRD